MPSASTQATHHRLVVPPVDQQSHAQASGQRVKHAMPQAAVKHHEIILPRVRQQATPWCVLFLSSGAVLLIYHHSRPCSSEDWLVKYAVHQAAVKYQSVILSGV